MKCEVVVDGEGEDEDDVNNFERNWGHVRHGVHHGILHGRRHEVMVGQANGHSLVEAGIGTGKMRVHLCNCRETCVVGAGDNTKMAQDVGTAIVGPACVPYGLQVQLDATL